ncbi:glycyl-radical enzyme activating protein [Dorea sp.]|nr:glycyl-radical enzyme activating protein [uncultured Dorea sp.]
MDKENTLTIFDLQRFALHDGPGIRTTVFLKGCPLDCLWCHNPESKKKTSQLGYLEKNCIGCRRCEKVCPRKVYEITGEGEQKKHNVYLERCIQCGKCVEACPNHALKIYGWNVTVEEIMHTVCKDIDFYQKSGGGLTISGGEPMLQFQGLLKLVKKAKECGMHVCLDTCGYADMDKYKEIVPYIDLFLFDYKVTGEKEHEKYTGVSNKKILENLDMLCKNNHAVILRCPIIPGINDHEEHYKKIAELSRKYPQIVEVNLMTYHDMAKGKAAQIGTTYALADLKTIEKEEKQKIYKLVESYGCKKLKES